MGLYVLICEEDKIEILASRIFSVINATQKDIDTVMCFKQFESISRETYKQIAESNSSVSNSVLSKHL